ncbi:MAG: DUF2177 family protein [Gemmatimonadetes bacterium]|nr:DUF2177 family protein [Gemmatimonadota bacterium]
MILKLFGIAMPTFLVLDLIWLGVLARPFYQAQLGPMMKEDVNWVAAFAFYVIYVVGIVILAVWPAVEKGSFLHAVSLGALLGLVAYAAFDLTGLATLEGFPRTMALVDLVWGTVLTGSVSAITYQVWFLLK